MPTGRWQPPAKSPSVCNLFESLNVKNDVVAVKPLTGYQLQVELADGRAGVFDLAAHLGRPGLQALKSEGYFRQVGILLGAVTWPDGEDIAPDTLAAGLKVSQPA